MRQSDRKTHGERSHRKIMTHAERKIPTRRMTHTKRTDKEKHRYEDIMTDTETQRHAHAQTSTHRHAHAQTRAHTN